MRTAYKCRVHPDPEQASVLNRTFGCIRAVWNRTLAWRHARYSTEHASTSYAQASAYLTAMKATDELGWLNEVSSVPLQQALRHQQAAFAGFFAGRASYPRYKSRTGRQCAEYTRSGFRYRDGQLFLAKMSTPLAFAWSWPDVDPASLDPSTVTVSATRAAAGTSPSPSTCPSPRRFPGGCRGGVDLGIKDFAVTSDGTRSRTRAAWPGGNAAWPATSGAWPAASRARRTGPRPGPRSPAPTARSAPRGPTSCTAPPPGWSATTT